MAPRHHQPWHWVSLPGIICCSTHDKVNIFNSKWIFEMHYVPLRGIKWRLVSSVCDDDMAPNRQLTLMIRGSLLHKVLTFANYDFLSAGASYTNEDYLKQHQELTWKSNYIIVKQRDVITYLYPNLNGDLNGWVITSLRKQCMYLLIHALNFSWNMLVKGAPVVYSVPVY